MTVRIIMNKFKRRFYYFLIHFYNFKLYFIYLYYIINFKNKIIELFEN